MALGQQKQKVQELNTNTYSAYKYSNSESSYDKIALQFSYWNSVLVMNFIPIVTDDNGNVSYDRKNAGKLFLSHNKAIILYNELKEFLSNPKYGKTYGITSGTGTVYIANISNKSYQPVLMLKDLDESGNVTSEYSYEFKLDHCSIRDFDHKERIYDKFEYPNIEIQSLMILLKEYYQAMTGAVAHSVKEFNKYDNNKLSENIESIMEKMGISKETRYKSNNSFFSSNGNTNASNTSSSKGKEISIDEIEDNLDI